MRRVSTKDKFCDLCWTFWFVDKVNGAEIHSTKVIGQPDKEPTMCPSCKAELGAKS